ncbi:MAG: pilus assembly protein N-terminal domain-containing protein [Planctomycetota bacterium]
MRRTLGFCAVLLTTALLCSTANCQDGRAIMVDESINSIQMVAGSTQPLQFPFPIPKLMVQIPEVIDANPVSTSEILVTGSKPGVSTLTVVDPEGNYHTITIEVMIDVRILQRTIDRVFPQCQVKVSALRNSVMLTGYVNKATDVENLVAVAKDYFPVNVINHINIPKAQNVAIKVKVYEVSRTKLREVGVDWSYFGADIDIVSSVSELISAASGTASTGVGTLQFGVVDGSNNFQAFIQALEQHNVAKLLDEPTLVAKDGRPAEFLSGGEIPIQVASGLGTNSVEFRPFGTKLDLVPVLNGQGRMTLEVRAEVSEIDSSLSGGTNVPGFRVRRVNTGVEILPGHTLALAGDYREDVEVQKRGLPKIMDHPFWGAPFRRISETKNETELVFLITPRFIGEVEASQMPPVGVGRTSASPSDNEFYLDSYLEVPRCPGDDCDVNDAFNAPAYTQPGYGVPAAPSAPVVNEVSSNQNQTTARQASTATRPSGSQNHYYQSGNERYQSALRGYSTQTRTNVQSSTPSQTQPATSQQSGFSYPSK